ncbi:MAG: hypothetical protein ACP5OO_01545 [Chloroflexia bacterium]
MIPEIEANREVIGEPIVVGERTIRPVARVRTRILNVQMRSGGVTGVGLRLSPCAAIVRERNGTEYRWAISKPRPKASSSSRPWT